MAVLEARDVTKTFDRVEAVLDGVTLSVHEGEVVVVMGRSGSGKTTLLNILAGLEEPTSGQVRVDGVELAGLEEEARTRLRRRRIGVVFQRFHLIPELTVFENVRLPMKLARRDDADQRARKLLEFFGIEHRAQAFPGTLSGGETQRAAMARGLGNDPAIVLADEPTANLDEDNAKNVLGALKSVSKRLGTSVLVATHDPLAKSPADRLLQLSRGRLSQRGDGEVPAEQVGEQGARQPPRRPASEG